MSSSFSSFCKYLYYTCFLLLVCFPYELVLGNGNGANPSACSGQIPDHGSDRGTGSYVITASTASYTPGTTLTITLSGGTFEGFLLSAFGTNGRRYGSFSTPSGSKALCTETNGRAVTHTSPTNKNSMTFTYTPPAAGTGDLTLQATLVANLNDNYYISLQLPEFIPPTPPNTPTSLAIVDGSLTGNNAAATQTVTVSWVAATSGGKTSYFLLNVIGPSPSTAVAQTINITSSTATTSTISSLLQGSTYTLSLTANNGVGASNPITLTVTTSSYTQPLPAPPANVTFSSSASSSNLVFNFLVPSNASSILGYVLQYRVGTTSNYTSANSIVIGNVTSYTFVPPNSVTTNTPLFFRIYSFSLRGVSVVSSELTTQITSLCPNSCSGLGTCLESYRICNCNSGYLGEYCQYKSKFPTAVCQRGFCLDYALVRSDVVALRMRFDTTAVNGGWFGFLWNAPDGMSHGDGYWGNVVSVNSSSAVSPFSVLLSPIYSPNQAAPVSITRDNDIVDGNVTGFFPTPTTSEILIYKNIFVEPTVDFSGKRKQFFSFAFGPEKSMTEHRRINSGRWSINWLTGEVTILDDPDYAKMYAPLIVGFVVIVIGAAIYHLLSLQTSVLGRKKVGTWYEPTIVDRLSFDILPTIYDYFYSESLIFLVYVVCVLAFFIQGCLLFDSDGVKLGYEHMWGHMTAVHLLFTLLPTYRNSIFLALFRISHERMIKWHRLFSRLAILFLWIHFFTMIQFKGTYVITSTLPIRKGVTALSGTISWVLFSSMGLFAWEPIRRRFFEWFRFIHITIFPIATIFAMIHSRFFLFFSILPLLFWVADHLLQYYRSYFQSVTVVDAYNIKDPVGSSAESETHVTKLVLKKSNFHYKPADFIYLNAPEISCSEWHPFTISTCTTGSETVTLHISSHRSAPSSFTRRLFQHVEQNGKLTRARFDGPYGHVNVPLDKCKTIVGVCGGIGVTPIMSLFTHLLHHQRAQIENGSIKLVFLWVARTQTALSEWFPEELAAFSTAKVDVRLYCTNKQVHKVNVGTDIEMAAGAPPSPMASSVGLEQSQPPRRAAAYSLAQSEVRAGRPDVEKIFGELLPLDGCSQKTSTDHWNSAKPHETCVLVCGPVSLVTKVQVEAMKRKVIFHKETFLV